MTAGKVAAEFISQQLTYVRARRDNVEARAVSLITTSGAVASIGLAFLGILAPGRKLSTAQLASASCALTAFIFACICGLLVVKPRTAPDVIEPSDLRVIIAEEHWEAPEGQAQRVIADAQVDVFEETTKAINEKGVWLRRGFILEVIGIALLGITVLLTIRNR
ncbi:hypothetical protein SLA_6515 [Streptomyces laurentii]|uniref:Pycsar effector protein domain-containing protein n=1 Tax=Streptomyces laurentii TaxID=39478 RepID=A0A160P8A2_STRLU|nr:hypothetical protein SLA_6515 [Streptomyces laurentii]